MANSRFRFEEVLFLRIDFHQLNLTRGSSYIPLKSWIANKKEIINPKNENDEECFKWGIIESLHHEEIKSNPERISNLSRFADKYYWSGLEFPVALNKIGVFEKKKDISVKVLGAEDQKLYPLRKSKYNGQKHVDLLLITDGDKWHYTAIKNMSRLYGSSNSKHKGKSHICSNCLQAFHSTESRDKHYEYCKDNEAVQIEMPEED